MGYNMYAQQTTCYESKWRFYMENQYPWFGHLSWTENGFASINATFNDNKAILTLHSTLKPFSIQDSLYTHNPSSLRFITNSYINGQSLEDKKFGMSFIDFWSKSSNGKWKTAEIRTIDDNSGDYDFINPNRKVKAGLAFHCASPILSEAEYSSREVFRIINGNMGIGVTDPKAKFEVQMSDLPTKVTIGSHNSNPSIRLYRATGLVGGCVAPHLQAYPWWIENNDDWQETGVYGGLFFKTGVQQCSDGSEVVVTKVVFTREGNVGIGVINPKQKLVVDGKICAKEVRVSLDDELCWPDFVFAENYQLTSLEETEKFIKQNKHLPNLPSANDVSKNGIELGEMNAKLLQKIEELTLHLIQLKKENEEIKKLIIKE